MDNKEFNKIPPHDKFYVRPKNAFNRLKAAGKMQQTVYICGTTGYGKTSLVTDYLKRKKYVYISAENNDLNKELRALTAELKNDRGSEKVVVIDDLYFVKDSEEREECAGLLEKLVIDPEVWLIMISRCRLPAWLIPLHVKYFFITITEDDLSMTEEETYIYIDNWDMSLSELPRNWIYKTSGGHPLFLKICCIKLKNSNLLAENSREQTQQELELIEKSVADFCDYLDVYVYDQWDISLMEFLMDISVVDKFDVYTARIVTRKNDAEKYILDALETGDFLIEYSMPDGLFYEMRKQMRYSMQRRMLKRYSKEYIDGIYYNAGTAYELCGETMKALSMYEKSENEEAISRILIENSRTHAGSGFYWEMRKYYLALPEEKIKKNPELMAGMSMLQSIMLNDEESERWYSELESYSKKQIGQMRKVSGIKLLYLDIALPQRSITDFLVNLKNIIEIIRQSKTEFPEISVTNNQPSLISGGKDICELSKNDRKLAESIGSSTELVLGKFGKGVVNLSLAESLLEKGGDDYEVLNLAEKGRFQAESGGKQELIFVSVGIVSWVSLFHNHLDDAVSSVESFMSGIKDRSRLYEGADTLKTRFLLYSADRNPEIYEWMKKAPDEDKEFCSLERYRYITKIRCYLAFGKKEKALALGYLMLNFAEKRGRTYLLMETKLLTAIALYRLNRDNWIDFLQDAVTTAEEFRFVRIITREGAAVWELLKSGNLKWRNSDFKKQVLNECKEIAGLYPSYLSEKNCGNVILSDKAMRILRLQAEGKSTAEIGRILGLSIGGVKYYNKETYRMLGVKSKAAAITEARKIGIL